MTADGGWNPVGSVAVVTGGASGIGAALAQRLATAGVAGVAVVDLDGEGARRVAAGLTVPAVGIGADLGVPGGVAAAIDEAEASLGSIDLWCGNAGVLAIGGADCPDDGWDLSWRVNVMAHVWAARRLVPEMAARGGGHFCITASAAGLLTQIGSAPYSVTKHAAVALAEWLSITYGDDGIGVTLVCPQAVATAMTAGVPGGGVAGVDGMISAEEVADAAVTGILDGTPLVLPHPEVATYARRRAEDPARWLAGMRRLQARFPSGLRRPSEPGRDDA